MFSADVSDLPMSEASRSQPTFLLTCLVPAKLTVFKYSLKASATCILHQGDGQALWQHIIDQGQVEWPLFSPCKSAAGTSTKCQIGMPGAWVPFRFRPRLLYVPTADSEWWLGNKRKRATAARSTDPTAASSEIASLQQHWSLRHVKS